MESCSLVILLAGTVLLALSLEASGARQLLQRCPIIRCAPGQCTLEQNDDYAWVWVCKVCAPGYRLLGSNICACPPGTYESSVGRCVLCEYGQWCRGGNGNGANATVGFGTGSEDAPTYEDGLRGGQRSYMESCGDSEKIYTLVKGALDETVCRARPGYNYALGGGELCPTGSYNPGANRVPACYRCPSGMITLAPGSAYRRTCIVPEGYTLVGGAAMPCPKGTYREGDVAASQGTTCRRCPRGWTTLDIGTGNMSECNILKPGYRQAANTTYGLTPAELCPTGSYYVGGPATEECTSCGGYITQRDGARSSSFCVAPPGYYLDNVTETLRQCDSGQYAEGWGRRTECFSCGLNIESEANTKDEHPEAAANDTIRGSSSDCVIPEGWGMIYSRAQACYRGMLCPQNTYGVAFPEYGLKSVPCTPCPRGMITKEEGSADPEECYNPAGWGVEGSIASVCGPGFFAKEGTRMPCTSCPPNRNTTAASEAPFFMDTVLPAGNGTDQDGIEDCKVIAGYGVVGTPNGTTYQLANWDTVACAAGSWSAGGGLTTGCQPCPGGRGTADTGSTSEADCDRCVPGFGLTNSSGNGSTCTGCSAGYYQDGSSLDCQLCQLSSFAFLGKDDLVQNVLPTSKPGTETFAGANDPDQCYPEYFQMDDNQGTHLVDTSTLSVAPAYTDAVACAAACKDERFMASTWVYTTKNRQDKAGKCYLVSEPVNATIVAAFKILPLDDLSGSTKGQARASGSYVVWKGSKTSMLGKPLATVSAPTPEACRDACDASSACVMVYLEGTSCTMRTGLEAPVTRTFINVVDNQIDTLDGQPW